MRVVVHNYYFANDDFEEKKHPRQKGGKFAPKGQGQTGKSPEKKPNPNIKTEHAQPSRTAGEKLRHEAHAVKKFMTSKSTRHVMSALAAQYATKHLVGVGIEATSHTVIFSNLYASVEFGLDKLGAGGPVTTAVAVGVAGYMVHKLMDKTGLTSEHAYELLKKASARLSEEHMRRKKERLEVQVADEETDSVLRALKQLKEVFEKHSLKELLEAAKKHGKEDKK